MRKNIIRTLLSLVLIGLVNQGCESSSGVDLTCGTYNGQTVYRGPKNGCYYINSNNNKTYVDHAYCNC